jgi:hypothetical protein
VKTTKTQFIVGRLYRPASSGKRVAVVYLGEQTDIFKLGAEKEFIHDPDHVLLLKVGHFFQVHDTIVYDLFVLTPNGNVGWARAYPDEWVQTL